MIICFKNLNFSRQKILHRIDFVGRMRFQFYDAFFRPITSPRTALKRMFTFSHEITCGAVRVI